MDLSELADRDIIRDAKQRRKIKRLAAYLKKSRILADVTTANSSDTTGQLTLKISLDFSEELIDEDA